MQCTLNMSNIIIYGIALQFLSLNDERCSVLLNHDLRTTTSFLIQQECIYLRYIIHISTCLSTDLNHETTIHFDGGSLLSFQLIHKFVTTFQYTFSVLSKCTSFPESTLLLPSILLVFLPMTQVETI